MAQIGECLFEQSDARRLRQRCAEYADAESNTSNK